MRLYRIVRGVYAYVGSLPRGCTLCIRGGKVVIFITGLCDENCFYCPVSKEKFGRDKVYVDEEPAHNLDQLLEEIDAVGAEGAGITGGDPLVKLDRTITVIRVLKEFYGDQFHIHLYTSGLYATADALRELERAGLDEIRFHVTREEITLNRIARALSILRRVDVGVEIPMLPDRVEWTKKLILKLDSMGVKFINLNELEVSESNIDKLLVRGYKVSASKPVVEGSEEAALEIVKWASEQSLRITVHYCPASYKDRVQMKNRIVRKAVRTAKPYQLVTPEGLIEVLEAEKGEDVERLVDEGYGEALGQVVWLYPKLQNVKGVVRRVYPALRRERRELPLESGERIA